MKKIIKKCNFVLLLCYGINSLAQQNVSFPDNNFKAALLAHKPTIDTDGNGEISIAEAKAFKGTINLKYKKITNLSGIEAFVSITKLICESNDLKTLDISKNTALIHLNCSYNDLTTLDVSNNRVLTILNCESNDLKSLVGINNTPLVQLYCSYNDLTALDINQNTELTKLNCKSNELKTLNVSNNTKLTQLICSFNDLTTLDISKNKALTQLNCSFNELIALDISQNTALSQLECQSNELTKLDVRKNLALSILECYGNQLTNLDVTKNAKLTVLECYINKLTTLDVSHNLALTKLDCDINKLTTLDVSKNVALSILECSSNQLTNVDVSHNKTLTIFDCDINKITKLDVSNNTALTLLSCDHNQLTSLDVKKNTFLKELSCNSNKITALDVSNNRDLTILSCETNNITTLDVSYNRALTKIECDYNKITILDVRNNSALTHFSCSSNRLTSINLKNFNNFNLEEVDAKYNPNLKCIQVDNAAAFKRKWSNNVSNPDAIQNDCIVEVNKVSINGADKIETKDGNIKLTATVLPHNATNKTLSWTIDKSTLATLSVKTGHVLLTAKADGVVTVTTRVKDGSGKYATKTIKISNQGGTTDIKVDKISIIGPDKIDKKDGEIKLTATVLPHNATNKALTWKIDKSTLATLSVKTDHVLLTAKADGVVTVTATSKHGSGKFATKTIKISNQNVTSIIDEEHSFVLFPNPAQDRLTIGTDLAIRQVIITDLAGKTVKTFDTTKTINIADLNPNVYLLKVMTDNEVYVRKLIKE